MTRAHILTVRTTVHYCPDSAPCYPVTLPCTGHQDITHELVCPYPADELGSLARACSMYMECDCRLDDEQCDELYESGEESCPQSPTGFHYDISNADVFPAIPIRGCWAQTADCLPDHIEDFQSKYGDGVWVVVTQSSQPECDGGVDFHPIARIEG